MRVLALALLVASLLGAADEWQLALLLKAQTDFDRVNLAATPQLPDTAVCVLSESALVPVSTPVDLPAVHYRKGYCTLAGAAITHNPASYLEAAVEFQRAIDAWPARVALQPRKSRLSAAPADAAVMAGEQQQIANAQPMPCTAAVMPVAACQADLRLGQEWLGWIALSGGQLPEAARYFTAFPDSGWPALVAGREAFQAGNYPEAAAQYRMAVSAWQQAPVERFGPPVNLGQALTDLGGAQLLSGDTAVAVATLDLAVKTDPRRARAFYYRARAKELAGHLDAALADYSLASRTAFAATVDLASGEAHLYRGIAAFRRKDFPRAEDEFSSALNFAIPDSLRADASAWRYFSAVAAGSCGASKELLARDLRAVSPFFPKGEASHAMGACATASNAK
ncbi:conserved exported hypothetical protein [Candidatus Sulfopaludibacter sp. SbA3]|nr:conserved exported hypothetical protein [Candidatus Sulfopaludibacter sp. SbA3]